MFRNIGNKIRIFATVLTWIGIVISSLVGIITMVDFPLIGLLIVVLGCFGSWLSSFVLYGFGELIVNVNEIKENVTKMNELSSRNN